MTLIELLNTLKQQNPDNGVLIGFGEPHIYQGYYYRDNSNKAVSIGFKPKINTTIGEMLGHAEWTLDKVFIVKRDKNTPVSFSDPEEKVMFTEDSPVFFAEPGSFGLPMEDVISTMLYGGKIDLLESNQLLGFKLATALLKLSDRKNSGVNAKLLKDCELFITPEIFQKVLQSQQDYLPL